MLKLIPYLSTIERVFLAGCVIGLILYLSTRDGTVLIVTLGGIGAVYFLWAYKPSDVLSREEDALSINEMIIQVVLPKVLWIAAAISAVGLAMYIFDDMDLTYRKMLIVGASLTGLGIVLLLIFRIAGVQGFAVDKRPWLRALPMMLIDLWLLARG